jgi:hypothetical protein
MQKRPAPRPIVGTEWHIADGWIYVNGCGPCPFAVGQGFTLPRTFEVDEYLDDLPDDLPVGPLAYIDRPAVTFWAGDDSTWTVRRVRWLDGVRWQGRWVAECELLEGDL